jgi:O-antigen/teichoic acid export membrane protein
MTRVRRSMAFSFVDRYGTYAMTVVGMVVLGRLLKPADFGVFAVGFGIIALMDTVRELGIGNYLVQTRELSRDSVRAAFTVTLLMSAVCAALLLAATRPLAAFYSEPGLKRMMPVFAANFLLLPFALPSTSLLRRSIAFDWLAGINLLAAFVNTATVIVLALAGQGYMCFVWATLASNLTRTVAVNVVRREFWAFVPSLTGWRQIAWFSGYSTGAAIINVIHDWLPQLLIGRILGFEASGVYSRVITVCQLPERLLVGTIQPVILPLLAERARSDQSLKESYLLALTNVSALQWPTLLCLALLANPIVRLLLGPQWTEVPHLVRIIAIGSLCLFPAFMTYPLMVALGRIRDTVTMSLIALLPSIAIIAGASFVGLEWVAAAQFINAPLQVYVALWFIRRRIDLRWGEIALAVRGSAVAALCAASAPASAVIVAGFHFDVTVPAMLVAAVAAVAAWVGGLWLAGHPIYGEIADLSRIVLRWLAPLMWLEKRMTAGSGTKRREPVVSDSSTISE